MSDVLTIRVNGADRLASRLSALAAQIGGDTVARALVAEAEIEMTEAKKRTPVDTGALRASGHVGGPFRRGNTVEVKLGFGGPSAPYAIFVHERLDVFHKVGQAKFLESVLLESAPFLPARVAERVRRGLGRQYAPSRGERAQQDAALDAMQQALDMED